MEATRTHSLRLLWPYGLPWRDPARTTALSVGPSGLLPVFANKPIDRGAIFWEHGVNRAVRAGNRKRVATHAGRWDLYDLSQDRTEGNDLAEKHLGAVNASSARY